MTEAKIKRIIRRNEKLVAENKELKLDIQELRSQINELYDFDFEEYKKKMNGYEKEMLAKIEHLEHLQKQYQKLIDKENEYVNRAKKTYLKQTNKAIKEFNNSLLNG